MFSMNPKREGIAMKYLMLFILAVSLAHITWVQADDDLQGISNAASRSEQTEGGRPMREIEGLRWHPRWISHLGCIKGCLDHLGIEVSMPWLYGATGYAFLLNIHDELCPSGWHVVGFPFFDLGENVGFTVEFLAGFHEDLGKNPELQKQVWDGTRKAIDAGLPCYGYDLEVGDYYVVYGYDDTGYYYSGPRCDGGKGPLPWQDLGVTGQVGILLMNVVKSGEPTSDRKAVKDALEFAVRHARIDAQSGQRYAGGLAGYDWWIRALETEKAAGFGMAYNSQCYAECRRNAVDFLKEATASMVTWARCSTKR